MTAALLEGVVVVDAACGVAAPFAGRMMAMLGADVHKVRVWDDWLLDLGAGPTDLGRCLDDDANGGKTEHVAEHAVGLGVILAQLLPAAHVLVSDWTPRRWRSLGLDPGELRERYPGLVVLSVTGYGLTGPDADRPWSELTTYHGGGEGFLLPGGDIYRAFPDRPPVRGGRFLADHDAGLTGAVAATAALLRQAVTGEGDLVEVSAQEVQLGLGRTTLGRAFYEGTNFDRSYAGYDYAGVLRCSDGWICLRPSEEKHWQSFTREIGLPELADDPRFASRNARFMHNDELNEVLGAWTAGRRRAEVRQAILSAECPGGPYLEPAEVLTDPAIGSRQLFIDAPGGGRRPGKPFAASVSTVGGTGSGTAEALRRKLAHGRRLDGPLAGLRVLDLSWVAAGPYCSELLRFLGADVLKVESETAPDLFRRSLADPSAGLDSSIRFADLNQGKRSVRADLKSHEGRQLVLDLVAHCDVLVENFRPGVRERLGFGDAVVHALHPGLVVLALSGFGTESLDSDRPGYASIFSAESALGWVTGYPDAPPADIRDSNDLRAGTLSALAALAGLRAVLMGATAVTMDVAARDALIVLQGDSVLQASRGGTSVRSGNALESAVPYNCYRGADGWVAIAVRTEREWRGLLKCLDLTSIEQLNDPLLRQSKERLKQRDRIDRVLGDWCAGRPVDLVVQELVKEGVPASRSAAASDLLADPHLKARRAMGTVEHPVLGTLTVTGPPFRFASAAPHEPARPPLLGEHTQAVVESILRRTPVVPSVG